MFTRLLRTLFWLLLWLLVVLLGPGGLLLFADRLNPGLAAMLACLWLALACLSLPVVLQVALRRVWFLREAARRWTRTNCAAVCLRSTAWTRRCGWSSGGASWWSAGGMTRSSGANCSAAAG